MKTDLIEAFIEELRTRSYSRVTLESTRLWLRRLRTFCLERFCVDDIAGVTAEHVEAFQTALRWELGAHGRLYSANTIQQALERLRLFFRWAVHRRHLLVDPTQDVVVRRVLIAERRQLSEEEVSRLLRAPDSTTPQGLRDRALLETLYGTGLRRNECQQLDVDDLDLAGHVLQVRKGKGGRVRHQPIGPKLAATLARYLEEGRPHLACRPEERALFIGAWGQRFEGERIAKVVRECARFMGLGRVTPHMLRRAIATHLLANGADLVEVQHLLGHQTVHATRLYAHVSPLQIAQEHRRTHPRARRKKPDLPPSSTDGH